MSFTEHTLIRKSLLLLMLLAVFGPLSFAQNRYTLSGTVVDEREGTPLPFAQVVVAERGQRGTTDGEGRFRIPHVAGGEVSVRISLLGYTPRVLRVQLSPRLSPLKIGLRARARTLREVVVSATESGGVVSSSKIGRAAMRHLQPTSFADLLELLPGGVTRDPDMAAAQTITLRETGFIRADGTKGPVSDDYAITSLGTQFVVDGVPMNTDANLQRSPLGGSFEGGRTTVNKGVDMRTISTDDIEKVEIIRGIPSAEYGNLTSGVVRIEKIRRRTPLNARFKADGYSKLFSVGKGVALGSGKARLLNVDLGYLDAKPDPRNNLINYKRVNASLRYTAQRQLTRSRLFYASGFEYAGSFDDARQDPELNHGAIDTYKSSYNRMGLHHHLSWQYPYANGLKNIDLNAAAHAQFDRLERTKLVAPQRYLIVPNTSQAGEHDATLLFKEYVADYLSDGKPFDAFVKLKTHFDFHTAATRHEVKAGGEWTYTKNFGRGEVYDMTRPLAASWSSRPRAYRDIPALQQLSCFGEEMLTAHFGGHTLKAMGGLRTLSLVGLDSKYAMSGKVYADPRANVQWRLPLFHLGRLPASIALGGGWGMTTRMPTLDYLFPDLFYHDIVQLGYYDAHRPEQHSRFNVRSYISDRTNYDLRAARNGKWEVRTDISIGGNRLSVNYFREKMKSGFRYMSHYAPYAYKQYDASGINSGGLQGPPALENLPYRERVVLDGYNRAANGSALTKEGVEFQFRSQRIRPLCTTLILNGAWFRSTYTNSQRMMRTVSEAVNGEALADSYVGIYNWNEGNVYNQLNTNILLDTQVPQWGLIFSTSLQLMWFTSRQALSKDGTPEAYLSAADGKEHPFTEVSAEDLYLQHLVIPFNDAQFNKYTVPMSMYVNLKVTKTVGKYMQLAFFVNRLIDHTPDFRSNGLIVRRNVKPYFGMELNFSL